LYNLDNHIKYVKKLIEDDIIDGVETYYSSYTNEQTALLETFCQENKLFMSAGSDCHGDRKKDKRIGIGYGNLNISEDIIKDWI